MPHYVLTYFRSRGRVESSRLALTYKCQKFEDVRLSVEEWFKVKEG